MKRNRITLFPPRAPPRVRGAVEAVAREEQGRVRFEAGLGVGGEERVREQRAAAATAEARAVAALAASERALDGERAARAGVIQRRFNVSVPRARVPGKAFTLRDRSER